METKPLLFLKNFFFKFNSAFLSTHLEDRLKHHKSLPELFLYFRKRLFFYILSFALFCFVLSQTPFFFQKTLESLFIQQHFGSTIGKIIFGVVLFLGTFYLMRLMQSILLRDADFFIARLQIATRYLSKPAVPLQYENLNTSHFLKFVFAVLSLIPLVILYNALGAFLHAWIVLPIFVNIISFVAIGILHTKNEKYIKKTKDYHQNDVSFFSSIEKYLDRIRILAFDTILKKKIMSFSENHSFLYQRVFENEMIISGIKYCTIFLFFALNSTFVLLTHQPNLIFSFLPILLVSALTTGYFFAFLKLFEYRGGAWNVFNFFKRMDSLNAYVEPIPLVQEEDNIHILSFEDASFVKDNQVVFHQLNHHLKKNILIAVIGSNQEERSNYLNACVGSFKQIGGKVYRPQDFEFLSKNSILLEGTIRENIVQFNDFDKQYYHEVLSACALDKEIEMLPAHDLTELNQPGTQFSASFLRKIAIARMVYSKPQVSFFDDPFLELSQHDSAKIFFEAFQKLLANTTRVFCTDKAEYAAMSDDIVFCKSGKVIEQGSHVTLIAHNGMYARLFYAGAENRRFEILQNYAKYKQVDLQSPLKNYTVFTNMSKKEDTSAIFGEQIFEKFRHKFEKFSHFMKMFFPVFVSKNFYAFFTFLTVSIWVAIYAFAFIFQHLSLNVVGKTSILFACFSLISCVAFSVMLIFYKNVYSTCAYIVENVSKFYFASLLTQNPSKTYANSAEYFDWKKEHILAVTAKFYNQLLNFLIIGFFCLTLIIFASTLPVKILVASLICASVTILFLYTTIETKLFFDEEDSKNLNEKFQSITNDFFHVCHEAQSKNRRIYLLEKIQAKLYGLYFLPNSKKKISFFQMLGFYGLWKNYHTIETMITTIKAESSAFKPKSLPSGWPSNGVIQCQDVKFNSEKENSNTFAIQENTRFMYLERTNSKRSVFIEKLRLVSPILSGEIRIDGEDFSLMNTTELRRRIGYVSSVSFIPFLSIRVHLDPYGYCDDGDVWEVLNKVGLTQHVALLKQGLSTLMDEVPKEMYWSGEVILFSLARCILNQNKIICIDHIEISEDVEQKICNIVETELKNCTVIFTSDNEKFKNLCSMIYSEHEGQYPSNLLNDANNSMPVTNHEESEGRSPFAI